MSDNVVLISLGSQYVVDFITNHPVRWLSRELARRGGVADSAGMPPTPAVLEFLSLLQRREGELFSQEEYTSWCIQRWESWFYSHSELVREAIRAKLYNNFYVSMIDSLHVWGLLSETGLFERCVLDACQDAVGKTDLTVYCRGRPIRLALIGPTQRAWADRQYKKLHRPGRPEEGLIIEVRMDLERERAPGNKRWFRLSDFAELLEISAAKEAPSG